MDIISKMQNSVFLETAVCKDMNFVWLLPAIKQSLEKLYFEPRSPSIFPALDITNELTIYAKLCGNVTIFYRQ